MLLVADVVARALLGITDDGVGLVDLAKPCLVPRLRVIRMKSLREKSIDPMNRLRVCALADLKDLVVVDVVGVRHLDCQ